MEIKGHLDLFSGIGGFSLGLKNAGVEPKWIGFSDIDKYANELYKRRFPDAEQLGTITDVSYKSLKGRQIDLLTGGFPCQSFSVAGKRQGFKDTRGTLFFDIQRLLQDYINNKSPIPCILLENVKGLLNHDNNRTFATIFRILSNLNYTIECQLVNTKWLLPQNRERIYIFGRYNGNPSGRKVFPVRENGKKINKKIKQTKSIEYIADYRNDEGLRKRKDGISPCLTSSKNSKTELSRMPLIVKSAALRTWPRTGKDDKNRSKRLETRKDNIANTITSHQLDSVVKEYKILDDYNNKIKENGICGTITQHCSRSARKNGMKVIENNSRIRRLTPIECERLQGFPDNWTDGQSDAQRYKQCGNAVSVPIVEMIMRKIYEHRH
tara:strand:- start:116 stop:1258 length:1143 start_codon:yes stop_codon:yes gene_type:complete